MKKVLFLLLLLVFLGTANINSQVRIGGDGEPYAAAVLDLNVDDSDTPTANKGALALPRVNLDDNTAQLNGTDPIAGMLVYNTNTTMGEGVYFWDGNLWVAIGGDGIVVDAVTDATASGGLVRSGSGTVGDPYTLGINTGGVTTALIADSAVSLSKLKLNIHEIALTNAASGSFMLPTTCLQTRTIVVFNTGSNRASYSIMAGEVYWVVSPYVSMPYARAFVWCFDS